MRFTYVDESGVSEHEPFVVVAGVLVDGDRLLAPVEDHLEALVHKYIPPADRDAFYFHATDIWQGARYFRDRTVWPVARRMSLLRELVWIPDSFGLPIIYGYHAKTDIERFSPRYDTLSRHDRSNLAHAYAFLTMTINLERHMRANLPDEVTFLTAEDRSGVRKTIKELQGILRRRGSEVEYFGVADALPLRKIRDTPHFAEKQECRLLQLADVCAFIINGHLRRVRDNEEFYDALWPKLTYHIKDEVWPVAQWPFGEVFRFWENEYWQKKMGASS